MDESAAIAEIQDLERQLKEKKDALFNARLSTMLHADQTNTTFKILEIKTSAVERTWSIRYTHYTPCFNWFNYNYIDDDTEEKFYDDDKPIAKHSEIVFGKNKTYFIHGGLKFNVYRNSNKELRIINVDYDIDLDIEQQSNLIKNYTQNANIPEWVALSILMYMIEHSWDDIDIIRYISLLRA
jgi:hypothetical protein